MWKSSKTIAFLAKVSALEGILRDSFLLLLNAGKFELVRCISLDKECRVGKEVIFAVFQIEHVSVQETLDSAHTGYLRVCSLSRTFSFKKKTNPHQKIQH